MQSASQASMTTAVAGLPGLQGSARFCPHPQKSGPLSWPGERHRPGSHPPGSRSSSAEDRWTSGRRLQHGQGPARPGPCLNALPLSQCPALCRTAKNHYPRRLKLPAKSECLSMSLTKNITGIGRPSCQSRCGIRHRRDHAAGSLQQSEAFPVRPDKFPDVGIKFPVNRRKQGIFAETG